MPYKDPHHDKYLCYFFDEEVSLGNLDIKKIIEDDRKAFFESIKNNRVYESYPHGRPIYLEGKKLIEYIEYYNNERIKLRLNGMSPVQYRTQFQMSNNV